MSFLSNFQLLPSPYYLPFLSLGLLMRDPLESFLHCPVYHAWVHKYFWILFSDHETSHFIVCSHFVFLSWLGLPQIRLEQSSNPGGYCPHVNNAPAYLLFVSSRVAVLKQLLEMTHCLRYLLHFWDSTAYSFALKCIIDLFELMYFSHKKTYRWKNKLYLVL